MKHLIFLIIAVILMTTEIRAAEALERPEWFQPGAGSLAGYGYSASTDAYIAAGNAELEALVDLIRKRKEDSPISLRVTHSHLFDDIDGTVHVFVRAVAD